MYQCRLFQNSETVETGWIYGSCYTITDQILLDGSQLNNKKNNVKLWIGKLQCLIKDTGLLYDGQKCFTLKINIVYFTHKGAGYSFKS